MGTIKKHIKVAGSKDERECEVLFDTGASACFVREDIAAELADILAAPVPLGFRLGDNSVMRATNTTDLFLDLKGHSLSSMFLVTPSLPYEVIVGADFFQKWKIKLDPAEEDFIMDEKALEIILVSLLPLMEK